MRYGIFLLLALFAAIGARPAAGEAVEVYDPNDNSSSTFQMEVTPADEPMPALKHRFSFRPHELQPGNSVQHYTRAFFEGGIDDVWEHLHSKYGEEIENLGDADRPISELPLDKLQAAHHFDSYIQDHIRIGTQSRDTDWGLASQFMEGPEIISLLLPEFQSMRSLSRAISLRTRLAIAEKDFDGAIDLIRMSYRLGQDVAEEPILVCSLIGMAICYNNNERVIDLIAAPNSPNLYWALAEREQPLLSMRDALRTELAIGPRMFPALSSTPSDRLTPGEWNARWSKSVTDFLNVGLDFTEQSQRSAFQKSSAEFAPVSIGLMGYSHAKQRLIDWGHDAEIVEAMPVGQVLSLYSARVYQMTADSYEKAWYVPLAEAPTFERAARKYLEESRFGHGPNRELLPVAALLLPAVNAARAASVRLERDMAALQTIEALRMHAARNNGKWPQRLSEVTCVPVPDNPATGQPFMYELEGETAILTLPKSDGVNVKRRYELTIAK